MVALPDARLSPREITVLHLIAWGYSNKEIANRLALSVKTIEAYKANGMRKLLLSSRAALVRYAVGFGWLLDDAAPADERLRPTLATTLLSVSKPFDSTSS